MQVGRVFISYNAVLNFCPLPPISNNGSVVSVKRELNGDTEISFKLGQRSGLLEFIKKINSGVTVKGKDPGRSVVGHPLLGHVPRMFNF